VDKIRVLLANYPTMIPDAIRELLAEQVDMEVVSDCRGPMHILQETGRTKADAMILAQEGTEEPGLCSQLLAVYPDLAIICVTSDLATVFTQRVCSHRRRLASAECSDLAQVLRNAVNDSPIGKLK
jgi:DNA-binding NarL/FixJ family response regulator